MCRRILVRANGYEWVAAENPTTEAVISKFSQSSQSGGISGFPLNGSQSLLATI